MPSSASRRASPSTLCLAIGTTPTCLKSGNGKLSLAENRAHFSMWAMLAAPLLAGNDLINMKSEIKEILTKKEVIAIDQDPLGKQARYAYSSGEIEVWTRDLQGGAKAIAILNVGSDVNATHPFRLDLSRLGLDCHEKATDLWSGKVLELTDRMPIELASRDISASPHRLTQIECRSEPCRSRF